MVGFSLALTLWALAFIAALFVPAILMSGIVRPRCISWLSAAISTFAGPASARRVIVGVKVRYLVGKVLTGIESLSQPW